jgi:hypothetical protein
MVTLHHVSRSLSVGHFKAAASFAAAAACLKNASLIRVALGLGGVGGWVGRGGTN